MNPHLEMLESRALLSAVPHAVAIDTAVGTHFAGAVGSLTATGLKSLTGVHALVDFGDGSTAHASFTLDSAGKLTVISRHTYTAAGDYTISFRVVTPAGALRAVKSSADITAPSAGSGNSTATGLTFDAVAGHAFSGSVGSFSTTYPMTNMKLATSVVWGDGTSSSATATANSTGGFDIPATHTYAKAGTYTVTSFVSLIPIPTPGGPTPDFILFVTQVSSTAIVT